jgi:hypothetical protein
VPLTERGATELVESFDAIAAGLDDLTGAAGETVDLLVHRARTLAPRATGELARSIRGDVTGSTATVTARAAHAGPVHFGVPKRGIRARPFLHRALELERGDVLDAYTADVQRLIDKAV